MYETEQYGRQEVKKSVRIETLPPILMIQLKRFEFNPHTYANEKIMSRFEYPAQIDFSKWLVESNPAPNSYELYGVLVHEGIKAQSGHYYVFLKVNGSWHKFNDQEVSLATEEQVYEYNFGGDINVIDLDSRELKVVQRTRTTSSTAYMLVYVKKQLIQTLLHGEIVYPEWLKEREAFRLEEKQSLKVRKNYYHEVRVLSWEENFRLRNANYIGLLPRNPEQLQDEENLPTLHDCTEIPRIPKAQKIQEFIAPYNQQHRGLYLYLTNSEKNEYESVLNLQHRKSTFQELIRELVSPLTLIQFPVIVSPNNYLYVIKSLTLKPPNQRPPEDHSESRGSDERERKQSVKSDENQYMLRFDSVLQVSRFERSAALITTLSKIYSQQGYSLNFYYEDKKDLRRLNKDNSVICGPASPKNILQILVVEKLPNSMRSRQDGKQSPTERWFSELRDTIQITLKSEDKKEQFLIYINQNSSVESLRVLIFEEKLRDNHLYVEPENIVLRVKPKKTSKAYIEIPQAKTVRDLVKGYEREKIIIFGPSSLKAEERVSQTEIKFVYRFKDFSWSPPLHIVVNKGKESEEPANTYQRIRDHPKIQAFLQIQQSPHIRLLLFSKDRSVINDFIPPDGHLTGKGEIASVVQKEKGCVLAVQSFRILESPDFCPILVSHKSANAERVGKPRYLEYSRDTTLIKLRQQIVQLIKDEKFEWEDKIYPLNPFKLELFAYSRDVKKGITLKQEREVLEDELEQVAKDLSHRRLDNNPLIASNPVSADSNAIVNSRGKANTNGIEDRNGITQSKKNGIGDNSMRDRVQVEIEQKDSKINEPKSQVGMAPQSEDRLNYRNKTIETAFSKARVVRVVVFHHYLVKTQNQMKIDVE